MLVLMQLILLSALLWWCAGAVANREYEQKRVEEALREPHEQLGDRAGQLEKVVQERTAKLQEMVNELHGSIQLYSVPQSEELHWELVHIPAAGSAGGTASLSRGSDAINYQPSTINYPACNCLRQNPFDWVNVPL